MAGWDRWLNRALEALWGLEAEPSTSAVARIERPLGFVVAERRPGGLKGGEWLVYLVRKVGVSSLQAARSLVSALGAVEFRVSGLKDADAVAYQYVYVRGGSGEARVEGKGWEAWLVGARERPPVLGGHQWNNFRLELRVIDGDPGEACRALGGLRLVPGFYGPQRFGVARPNTHLQGLLLAEGALGALHAEMAHEYPLGGGPGGYEERTLRAALEAGDPLAPPRGAPARLLVEAVQSYVWNRALSAALREGLEGFVERRGRAACPGGGAALLARLPSRRLLEHPSTPWAGLVATVVREEALWPVLPARAGYRPLAVEACRVSCSARGDEVVVWLTLPRGIYATVAVRSALWVDWLGSLSGQLG